MTERMLTAGGRRLRYRTNRKTGEREPQADLTLAAWRAVDKLSAEEFKRWRKAERARWREDALHTSRRAMFGELAKYARDNARPSIRWYSEPERQAMKADAEGWPVEAVLGWPDPGASPTRDGPLRIGERKTFRCGGYHVYRTIEGEGAPDGRARFRIVGTVGL